MTYWLYQHLGNLSPHVIRDEGILERLLHVPDGRHVLEDWARSTDEFSSGPDHYHFNYVRELGPLRLVMIDARNGRDLTPGARRIVDENEWEWIVAACNADDVDHLLIGSSLPVFMPPALHDLEVADEAVNDGRWGKFGVRLGEWFRRRADMEDWPAFGHSFDMFVDLLERIGGASNPNAPRSISVLSGDIHFSYISEIVFPPERPMSSDVHQLVSSPIRNVLVGADRAAMRIGKSHVAHVLARGVRRGVGRRPAAPRWQVDHGPFFENSVGQISLHGDRVDVSVLQARPYDPAEQPQLDVIIDLPLCVGR